MAQYEIPDHIATPLRAALANPANAASNPYLQKAIVVAKLLKPRMEADSAAAEAELNRIHALTEDDPEFDDPHGGGRDPRNRVRYEESLNAASHAYKRSRYILNEITQLAELPIF